MDPYTEKLLQKFGMHNSKPASTPTNFDAKLVKEAKDSDSVWQSIVSVYRAKDAKQAFDTPEEVKNHQKLVG